MSIQWRADGKTYDMFPIKYTTTNNNKMFMTPIYKEGTSAFAFPGNGHDTHILQISHRDLNVSANGDKPWPMSASGADFNIGYVQMCLSSSQTVSVNPGTSTALNPYYFRDIGYTGVSGFKSYQYSWSSTKAWPGSGDAELWDWTKHEPKRNGTIYCDRAWDGENRADGVAWGFVIALNKTNLWPSGEAILSFGTIFAVPASNNAHAITIYFKGGAKGNLTKTIGSRTGGASRNIMRYTQENLHFPLCAYVTDDKLKEGVPANWGSNTMDYFETTYATTKTSPYRSHKDIQLIGKDSSYKYILAKGRMAITKDDCHIFTPPGVAYSGDYDKKTYAPTILDAWISIIPSHYYGS